MTIARHHALASILTTLLAAVLGACSSTPVATPPATSTQSASPPLKSAGSTTSAPSVTAPPSTRSTVASTTLPPYLDPKSDISTGRSVYFDFDSALVRQDFGNLIDRHGKYLIANPALAIKIEGNTDERGSAEYNLALGQQRAESVRQALKIYGVPAARMEAVSWGRERPQATGHDEAAWAQNRRADLQYPAR
ncbi:peptidoglycan-associated lipoprotein Pal [Aquabacterium sp.]|uniref:peptidoglycan-associated lipoprotein Pal n=1 Tax=Aquabacterium sp. TaxID=1872578 RepID=UPI002BC5267D|nr:peptidoglycan-associated lipoprotein Pal [Aquabacterium sp.]HSW07724.1 peptidoglycan-associated lipoprotein Pal [Aquabacterium sp.]